MVCCYLLKIALQACFSNGFSLLKIALHAGFTSGLLLSTGDRIAGRVYKWVAA